MDIAGGIPEVYLTSFQLLRFLKQSNNLNSGSNILIHGAASGVGTTLIQLVTKVYNSNAICTCSFNKVNFLKQLGANFVVDRRDENKLSIIKSYLNSNTVNNKLNAVLDHVGKNEFENNIDLLGVDGSYVSYGAVSGSLLKNFDIKNLLNKRINLIFTTLASRSDDYKSDLINEFKREILPLINSGYLKIIVHNVLPFSANSLELAHKIIENNENIGKIIIKL
jgi:tumor protein p53-inducible protein 3